MSLMIVSSASADRADRLGVLALLGVERVCRAAGSVMPMTPFIGVRISWLMLARNSDFSRDASFA